MWVLHPKSKKHLQYSIYIGIRFIRQFQNRAQAPPENLVSHNIFSELPALRLGVSSNWLGGGPGLPTSISLCGVILVDQRTLWEVIKQHDEYFKCGQDLRSTACRSCVACDATYDSQGVYYITVGRGGFVVGVALALRFHPGSFLPTRRELGPFLRLS
jgi:hypothetical protein